MKKIVSDDMVVDYLRYIGGSADNFIVGPSGVIRQWRPQELDLVIVLIRDDAYYLACCRYLRNVGMVCCSPSDLCKIAELHQWKHWQKVKAEKYEAQISSRLLISG